MPLEVEHTRAFPAAHRHRDAGPQGRWHGHNYELRARVRGTVQADSGVLVWRSELESGIEAALAPFDHADLNAALGDAEPELDRLAPVLWSALAGHLPVPIALSGLELRQDDRDGVRLDARGLVYLTRAGFAAAHRTHAPALSAAENLALYGICNNPAGHGHNYVVEVESHQPGAVPPATWAEFDHRNLSVDIPELRGRNIVTETLAALIARRLPGARPVRVWELPDFSARFEPAGARYILGRRYPIHAAHSLYNAAWSEAHNQLVFGSCGKPGRHGHTYGVEVLVEGTWDERTESALDLGALDAAALAVLSQLDGRELEEPLGAPATLERLTLHLWQALEWALPQPLASVGVTETANRACWAHRGRDGQG